MAIKMIFVVFVLCTLVVTIYAASIQKIHKSAEDASRVKREDDEPEPECGSGSPCGWAVYTRFTRQIEYFMKNTCICPEKTNCQRDSDDLSIAAYVYRCTAPTTNK